MEVKFRSDQPIYSQLVQQIELAIVSGELQPGARLAPVRDMATRAGVNPNTMQRALQELERTGMVYSQRTAGRFVTEDAAVIAAAKKARAGVLVRDFLEGMRKMGCSREEILTMLQEEEETNGNSGV